MMKYTKDLLEFLDLSHLSTDEELAIRQVLQRDDNLRKRETGRIRRLQISIPDPKKLKVMTGEWFEELRTRRYGRQSDVAEVLRSSMRRKKPTAFRTSTFSDVGQTENKEGEKENKDPQTKASEIQTPDTSFLNLSFREKANQELSNEESTVDTDNTTVDVPEWKHPLYRSHEGPASEEKCTNPFTSQNQEMPYSNTTDTVHQSPDRKPGQENKTESAYIANVVLESQLGPINVSSPGPQTKPTTKSLDTIVNLKSSRKLVFPAEIKDDPEKNSSVMYVEPYVWTQPEFKSSVIEAEPKDTEMAIGTTKTIVILPRVDTHNRSEDSTIGFDVEHSEHESLTTPSFEISSQSSHIRPKPKEVNFTHGKTNTAGTPPSGDTLTQSEDKFNNRRPDDVVSERVGPHSMQSSEVKYEKEQFQLKYEDMLGLEYVRLNRDVSTESQELQTDQNHSEMLSFEDTYSLQRNDPLPTIESFKCVEKPQYLLQEEPQDILTIDKHVPVDESSIFKEARPKKDLVCSEESLPFAVHVQDEVIISSNLHTSKEDTGEDKEKEVSKFRNYSLSQTAIVGGMKHVTKMDHRVSPGDFDEENKQEQMDVKKSTESLSKAVDGQTFVTLDGEGVDIFKERNTLESKLSPNGDFQKVNQETGKCLIPTIVVNSSESPVTDDTEEHPATSQEPPSVVVTPMDTWEDEGLDSDDCSSVSSYGSDFSARRGYGSIALGLTGRTGSLLSVYSEAGDFGSVTVQGAVEFSLRYRNAEELIVTVEQCQDLAYANPRKQRTDPYVKTYLHPDKSRQSKKKTSIKKRTINPVFGGETLKYKMTMDDLKGRTLNLSVWHNDSRGRNVFLGQVDIDLKTWNWGHETLTWYNLQPKNPGVQDSPEYHGLLTVALKYIPPGSTGVDKINSGEVHVWLKEARELRKLKPQGVDSFVKCYMLPDTSKKSRQKTRVVKKSQKPVYNHAMVYDGFRAGEVREACCELTVWDHNKLSNQFLGGVRLSLGTGQSYGKNVDWMESVNEEIQLWENMLSSPDAWVEGEIPLRSSMTPRK
ncbi:synaptotagmin-like protein 1 isoform X1 [Oncorhynchus tshawytscha]|uniref:synaptotagmin-like protein 1 isoform X1 n=1 Tax=Oncorhynchus tshawytscha TaxID=74940 RepID=UPI000D09F370|nr:synaptotagmin-like protein 1 isoform X1 [Oncorhynchus tshawytscha]XP_024285471.1 synaptotagmin-like protein 1 isoform X1 [Oncorhynchus tshawytscha]